MSDTLIFTGWGLPVYASAAAMALRCKFACDADVEGVSRRYLAKLLERKKEKGYDPVAALQKGDNDGIAGMSMALDVPDLLPVLKEFGVECWRRRKRRLRSKLVGK